MKLYIFNFLGSYTGGSLVIIAESEEHAIRLYNDRYAVNYIAERGAKAIKHMDMRPVKVYHSYDEYVENFKHRSELLLIEAFDVPDQPARIVTDSYHDG